MNTILLFLGALIPIVIYIKIWNANQIILARRVSSFISAKSASQEIKQSKRKSIIRKRVNEAEGLSKLVDLPTDFKDGISKAIRENAFGKPLMIALNEMSDEKESKVLKPLIKQMETAISRGTPLAEVSRKFAEDQRLKFRNLLMKQAAAKEISMLIPVVFVVLPSVLAVAMYPALTVLQKLG